MTARATSRFEFIGHALNGTGGFRPSVSEAFGGGARVVNVSGPCYLTRYARESDEKYGRRAEVAFYASPLARACSRFVGYIATRPPVREFGNQLYQAMADDIDGKGYSVSSFLQQFMVNAKARGSMLMLVDMPARMSPNLAAQLAQRNVPYWTSIAPELLTEWEIGDDGRFNFVEFPGVFTSDGGESMDCTWRFDRDGWQARDEAKRPLGQGSHALGECPVLIWTEGGAFPHFGPFSAIADLSRRLFNLDSELDEILRAQTFSLLTMQAPDGSTSEQKLAAAQVAGQTISTSNMLVHSGSTPAFIAPPDGPARVYIDRINNLRDQVREIGLDVATVNQQESGIAMQMRFQSINAELARFADGMEDFERRAWDVSRRWLGMQAAPSVEWQRDYDVSDVAAEMQILADMQGTAMPPAVIAEQRRRVVSAQFGAAGQGKLDELNGAIDEMERGIEAARGDALPADRNAEARAGLLRLVNGA